jgi:diguanylate cyclase (GGDEF)-like protein
MIPVFLRAAAFSIVATFSALFLIVRLVPATGGAVDWSAMWIKILCPLVVLFLCSVYFILNKHKLRDALDELTIAHKQLADTHAELTEAYARLAEKSRHDEMTGLLNRESFFGALKNTRRRNDAGALLVIDADNFKYINDTHGHQQGDVALLLISDAIRRAVREDDLVGRIGGEEFAAFLPGASDEDAMLVAERMRISVEELRFHPGEGKYLPLSISIGASRLRPHVTWSEMMREADLRLYEAKRRGRNRVVFDIDGREAA